MEIERDTERILLEKRLVKYKKLLKSTYSSLIKEGLVVKIREIELELQSKSKALERLGGR